MIAHYGSSARLVLRSIYFRRCRPIADVRLAALDYCFANLFYAPVYSAIRSDCIHCFSVPMQTKAFTGNTRVSRIYTVLPFIT